MFARINRVSSLVVALSVGLSSAAIAQGGFEYAPGTAKYRIASSTKGVQEVMGQKQEAESSTNQLVTVTVARPMKDTLALTVVLDSLTVVGPMGITPPGTEKLVGMKVSAKLSPFGAFYASEAPKDSAMATGAQLAEGLSNFLPRIRGKLTSGSTWTDTTTGKVKNSGFEIDRRVISRFTVVGDTTVGGEKSWKIARESNTTLTGSGAPQGQAATMEGTSTAKSTVVISQKGVFVGSNTEDQANLKFVFAANGMELGLVQTSNTKIEKVR
jgi:hypothetical protein